MSENESDQRPVEVFCPICGYTSAINDPDDAFATMTREEKLRRIRAIQQSGRPVYTCSGCEDPQQSAQFLEIK